MFAVAVPAIPALLRCRDCGAEWDTTQWHRAGKEIAARRLETGAETRTPHTGGAP